MIMQKDLKKLFHQLGKEEFAQIELAGSNITIRVLDHSSMFSLSTPVYFGGNFIPKSVRHCISQKVSFASPGLKTNLSIDEGNFLIYLNYLGAVENLNGERFKELLEDFSILAEEWRLYLDEHDKNDLLHVRVK